MVLTPSKQSLQNHETCWVIINSKNTHSNRELVSEIIHSMILHHGHFLAKGSRSQKPQNRIYETRTEPQEKERKKKKIFKEEYRWQGEKVGVMKGKREQLKKFFFFVLSVVWHSWMRKIQNLELKCVVVCVYSESLN